MKRRKRRVTAIRTRKTSSRELKRERIKKAIKIYRAKILKMERQNMIFVKSVCSLRKAKRSLI